MTALDQMGSRDFINTGANSANSENTQSISSTGAGFRPVECSHCPLQPVRTVRTNGAAATTDRWRNLDTFRAAVFAALGNAPEVIETGRLHRFTTNGRPGDLAGWCQFFDDGRAGVFGCWRDGTQGVWSATDRRSLNPAQAADLARQVKAAAAARAEAKREGWGESAGRLASLWGACKPVQADGTGTDPVTLYLRHRLALAAGEPLAVPDVIRWHPGLSYHHQGAFVGTWPAMVAGLQGPDGAAVALHRTWLTPEGRKAPTPGPVKKLSSAAGPVMTGCIRLAWPGDGAGDVLGIAEGVETAMAARQASGVACVAAYCAGALATWQWPRELRRLVIFADADAAGAEAANTLRLRAAAAGLAVQVMTPTTPGTDWADVWAARGAAGVAA